MRNLLILGFMGAAAVFSAPIVTVIPTIGPSNVGFTANYLAWEANVINGMRNNTTPGSGVDLYNPLANGASVAAGSFLTTENAGFPSWLGQADPGTVFGPSFANELGGRLYFSVKVVDSTASFSLADINVGPVFFFGTDGSGALSGPLGGDYAPDVVGIDGSNNVLESDEPGSTLVKELYFVGVAGGYQVTSAVGTQQQRLDAAAFDISSLADRTTSACYQVGTNPQACASLNIPFVPRPPDPNVIPEPGTWALMGIGLAGLAMLRRKA